MKLTPEQERLVQIFHPYMSNRNSTVISEKIRFVHYTNVEAAMNILRTKEVWMRKSSCMNDFMEVQHGLNCLRTAYRNEPGNTFRSVLNKIFDKDFVPEVETLFNSWITPFLADTYLTCVSEHMDTEDVIGRLSMWRAYGERTGVALVMNNSVFVTPSDALKAYSSPVAYLNEREFEPEFTRIVDNIRNEANFIKAQGRDVIKQRIFNMFRFATLCTKHPGFSEEKEWRIVYSPSVMPSVYLTKDIRVINGVPQPIFKIPLKDIPDEDLSVPRFPRSSTG